MNCKKILALVLTLCLLFGVMSPAASAVSVRPNDAGQTSGKPAGSGKFDDLLASAAEKLGIKLKKDEDKLSYSQGQWLITSADGTVSVAKNDQLPEHIQALREAAQYYAAQELVAAFVVLEGTPTAEKYSLIAEVPQAKTEELQAQQNVLIEKMETQVLKGEYLNVITQFTHLTNSVVIETAFENLEAIAAMEGVKSVFISPIFYPCETSKNVSPYTSSSGVMTGVSNVWHEMGYTGKGMTIAILDTGLDLDHPSFAAAPEGAAWSEEYVQEMLDKYDLNCEARYERKYSRALTADKVYDHEKVPFIFNYAMGTTNVLHNDSLGDHGTHVAGIAAANNVEGTGVVGMAPDAQIIAMKVFNSNSGGSNMYDLVAALEDCLTMGIDVVNMSLGSAAGFASANDDEIDSIFRRIADSDIIVDVAAGNDGHSMYGSLYDNYKFPTDYIDTATIASPSSYINSMSIASANNSMVYGEYFMLADGTPIHYMYPIEVLYGYVDWSLEILADQDLEYVILDGMGNAEDYYDAEGNSLVEGKVVVVKRGTIQFAEKALNAQDAGAVACLIWDNVEEDIFSFGMTMTYTDPDTGDEIYPAIPAVLISLAAGQTMANAATKRMTPKDDLYPRADSTGGQMSSFSSWGVSPELRLIPDLTGIGGNVYSCYDGGEYGLMSGTSMATPQVAGVTAVMLQYLKETYPDATEAEIRAMVDGLMMSTAVPIIDDATGLEASPRQQGAGLVNAYNAIRANAFLSVEGTTRAKAELGDNADGKFSFTVTVNNTSKVEKVYNLSASLLCEGYVTDALFPGEYFVAAAEHKLDKTGVTFSKNTVTVPAGDSVDVTVTIELTEADKQWIDTYFPKGNYVEGYVYFTPAEESDVTLSIPFLGFYQDWNEPDVFDTGMWYDNSFWGFGSDSIEAIQYYNVLWTSLGSSANDFLLGINPYANSQTDENGNLRYDPKHNVLSPNGDGILDNISDYYLSLMRNVKWLKFSYTDEKGNVVNEEVLDYISKTMYNSSYGATIPFVYSWEYSNLYDFTDANGDYLPDGTVLYLTISAILAYGDNSDGITNADGTPAKYDQVMETIPIYIDTVAPVLVGAPVESNSDGRNYMTLTIKDANPACVALMNKSGSMTYAKYDDMDMTDNGDDTWSVSIDVTGLGDNFVVAVCDYGGNEAYYNLTWSETGTNNPEIDEDALYAYRIYDLVTGYYYGYDFMYGWGTIDKTTGAYTEQRSDAYEYYAITAAEYVDGWVFAVDAGYNLVRMQPGLWNREWICNLGVNVVDMAFDDVNGKMYLTTKTTLEDGYSVACALYTMDLLTGELTMVKEYIDEYSMPWSMTFVGDKLYTIKKYYAGIYEVDIAGGTYAMSQVKDGEGKNVNFKYFNGSYESSTSAGYAQSMTYSEKDGKIYWAYYPNTEYLDGTLFVIDPTDWSYTYTGVYEWSQEYVGLLTLDETKYQLPESKEVTNIALDPVSLVMVPGDTNTLTASALPWNAPMTEKMIWSSSDDSVATVVDGKVTAVGAGEAVITVAYGNVEATCSVLVVDVKGTMYGYNSYSDDDSSYTWMGLDLESMVASNLGNCPVDIVAGDYNGHDGFFYGYDVTGQCYKIDTTTGKSIALGVATNKLVADMAYDYLNGFMYAIVYDQSSWTTTICRVNMSTGALVDYAVAYDVFLTLACDMYGQIFVMNTGGELFLLTIYDDPNGGIEWGPLTVDDVSAADRMVETISIMETNIALSYQQSMCYDHNNDVILWSCPDNNSVYWLDLNNGYMVDLGAAEGVTIFQYFGTFVIPEQIPELPYVPVEDIECQDIAMLEGAVKLPVVSVNPLNATNRDVSYVSADESIAKIENGNIVGVSVGTTTITGTLVDGENTYTFSFNVSVKGYTDKIYAYELYDVSSGDGNFWMGIDAREPENYEAITYVADDAGNIFLLYSAEYVASEGVIYAYGYIYDSTDTSWYFMTIDPTNWQITNKIQKPSDFATFVYDMAFDYTTGTMYAVAGPSSAVSDLYYVDMATGDLVSCMAIGEKLMGLVVTKEGQIYTMASSTQLYDEWGMTTGAGNAILYKMDVVNGTYEPVLDTGVKSNMIAPMTYDYDTGYLYWNAVYRADYFSNIESGLYLIDLVDNSVCHLGRIGVAGSQVSCLLCLAEEYPTVTDKLCNVTIVESMMELAIGDTDSVGLFLQPYNISSSNANIQWKIADPGVATVDKNGLVTAVSAGMTTLTVSVTYNDVTMTSSCAVVVYGNEDYLITYDRNNMGFATISRTDPTKSTMLTQGEEVGVTAMEIVNGIIYGYDDNGNLFRTDAVDGYVRTVIGGNGVEVRPATEEATYYFTIRDMAWDAVNNRMLVLGVEMARYDYGYFSFEAAVGGCKVYEADLTTGKLTELVTVIDDYGDYDPRVMMLAVDGNGDVYVLSYLMSNISKLDMQTGYTTNLTSFQNQGTSASDNGNLMAMAYDKFTNSIYISFAENSSCYELYRYDVASGALTRIGYMGETDIGVYYSETHVFNGLLANEKHICHGEIVDYRDPTCTTDGYTGDMYCKECGRISEYGQTIPATGHQHFAIINMEQATCDKAGYTGDVICRDCGEFFTAGSVISATGHQNTEIRNASEATCTAEGYTGDTYCVDCGEKLAEGEKIAALGHKTEVRDASEATCTAEGYTGDTYCTDCGEKIAEGQKIAALGHKTEIRNASEATCTAEGYTGDTYCTVCGEKIAEGQKIAAKGHGKTEVRNASEPTCTADGYTGDTYCTVCGEKTAAGEKIAALGHKTEVRNASEATCTAEGYTGDTYCTVCGEKVTSGEAIAKKAHSYTSVVTEPTTEAGGYTTHTCTVCGDSYVDSQTDPIPADHTLVIVVAAVAVVGGGAAAAWFFLKKKRF